MLSKKMEEALNAQINAEFWSAYLYLSMSMHFENAGLSGFAKWFSAQADEEKDHALKFINYVNSRGGKVSLAPIAKVTQSWKSPLAAFEDTLKHEKEVTKMIHSLVALAETETGKDYATISMLQWFIDEQVEEEETAQKYVDALKFVGDDKIGIYMLNNELGNR